jgi:hypothetical protein
VHTTTSTFPVHDLHNRYIHDPSAQSIGTGARPVLADYTVPRVRHTPHWVRESLECTTGTRFLRPSLSPRSSADVVRPAPTSALSTMRPRTTWPRRARTCPLRRRSSRTRRRHRPRTEARRRSSSLTAAARRKHRRRGGGRHVRPPPPPEHGLRRAASRPRLLASSPRVAESLPSSPPATATACRCRRRSASTPSRGAGTLARQRASCRWLRYCKDAPAPACERACSGAPRPTPLSSRKQLITRSYISCVQQL